MKSLEYWLLLFRKCSHIREKLSFLDDTYHDRTPSHFTILPSRERNLNEM